MRDSERICREQSVDPDPPDEREIVGVALHTLHLVPLNGLRHPRTDRASGWYIWGGGEPSIAADFFSALCFEHLNEHCPLAVPFLSLPAGWRFLVADGHVDVWRDDALLDV